MLIELHIKNFALIDEACISFHRGLNMFTGETGAGKSILIDSINFILGDKQNKDIIRVGEESAFVEGIFSVNNKNINNLFEENGIDCEDNIIISREINKSGKSISRINGKAVTVSLLKSIGKHLIDIHGQHEHQSLLNEGSNIHILDLFCGEDLYSIKQEYKDLYKKYISINERIDSLSTNEKERLRMIDLLSFQDEEIREADLRPNEDEELKKERDILANSQKIHSSLTNIYSKLYMAQIGDSALDALSSSLKGISAIEEYDTNLASMREAIEGVYYQLESICEDIRGYKIGIDYNEGRLNEIEGRLDTINKLKRKYGSTIDEIIDFHNGIQAELSNVLQGDEIIKDLEKERDSLLRDVEILADKITFLRKKGGQILETMITQEFKYLGMEKAIFKVSITSEADLHSNGRNKVSFLMTANPGQPLKPLSKVASGGEMSRIMLAIKTVIADIDDIPTLIFDEVDTGISGRTAQAVAEKMSNISKSHQLLCVTHLPQIAAMSDCHFKIEKTTSNNSTLTSIKTLTKLERIEELARMLGGMTITDLTRKNALEVLEMAQSYKKASV
ncbi:MAG: DNA repair protein RecN [Clostridium sp.]|uniref:DNA repair protein RecN n=1 Tax=Clostridium sp. TaxID=1506 RepID=UPI002FC9F012